MRALPPDPPLRPDGTCAECSKPRKLAGLKAVYLRDAERDPFCSTDCARAWHDAPRTATVERRVTPAA